MKHKQRTSLISTGRLAGVIVLLLLAGLTATNVMAVRTLRQELVARLDAQLLDDARNTRRLIESLPEGTLEQIGASPGPRSSTALIVLDSDGEVVHSARAGTTGQEQPLPDVSTSLPVPFGMPITLEAVDGGLQYRAVSIPTSRDFTVVLASPLDPVRDTVTSLARRLAIISIAAFVILGLLMWAVVKTAGRQLDNLVGTAARIGSGDLSARVELPASSEGSRLGHALNDMTGQLEAAFAAREESEARLRRFAADASHDLRTPLTHIRGYAELLRNGMTTDQAQQARAASRIETEAARMASLVDDLLLLARLDQERPLHLTPVDLRALVNDAVDDARAADSARTYILEAPDQPVTVHADEARLRQVLTNVLGNVAMHTPPGTIAVASLATTADTAVIEVRDDGRGMSHEQAGNAFDRFYRSEAFRSSNTGGSGLGLAITRSIIEGHHGTTALHSTPGEGTTVTITIPMS